MITRVARSAGSDGVLRATFTATSTVAVLLVAVQYHALQALLWTWATLLCQQQSAEL